MSKALRILHHRRSLLIAAVLLLLVLGPLLWLQLRNPAATAAWYNDNYAHRQYFSFTHNADISADRAITFSLDTAELIADGVMQADCDDTRFTDLNGKLLDYELTGTCNDSATTYEVVFTEIHNGKNAGYVYYGNPSAVSASQDVSGVTELTPSGGDPAITTRTNEEDSPGPILFWKLDENYGTTAQDQTEHNNDGTISGTTWRDDICVVQNCLEFDGSNDNITRADDQGLDFAAVDGFTVQAWIKHVAQTSGIDTILAKYESTGADGGYILRMESDGDLSFGIDDANGNFADDLVTSTAASYDDNQWHLVTGVVDGTSSITLYIDGQQIAQDTTIGSTGSRANDDALYVGIDGDGTSNPWAGFLDEVKIYPYARSAAEIKQDFLRGSALHGASASFGVNDDSNLTDGLVGWWKMDESSLNGCSGGEDSCDSSGNGNHGTWEASMDSSDIVGGKFGNGVDFDGTDDYIIRSVADFQSSDSQGSIAAWVNFAETASSDGTIFASADQASTTRYLTFYIDSGTDHLRIQQRNNDTQDQIEGSTDVGDDQWHHVVVVSSGTSYTLYVDATPESLTVNSGSNNGDWFSDTSNRDNITIGTMQRSSRVDDFNGQIDDVRTYNYALTAEQVKLLYNSEAVSFRP